MITIESALESAYYVRNHLERVVQQEVGRKDVANIYLPHMKEVIRMLGVIKTLGVAKDLQIEE